MADDMVIEFENVIEREGRIWRARAVGYQREDGLWEGRVEFEDAHGQRFVTDRETTQPNRDTMHYWATGLTHGYLEGALDRAVSGRVPLDQRWAAPLHPGREDRRDVPQDHARVAVPRPAQAVLDPFAVYAEGRDLLRDQLGALHTDLLRNIIRRYGMANAAALDGMTDWEMRALILQAVERHGGR